MSQSLASGLPNGLEQLSLNESGAMGILEHLQKDELQSLLDDDNKLEQLIQDSEVVSQIEQAKQTLVISNKSLAEYNLSKEEKLIQNRNLLAETYGQMEELLKRVQRKKFQLESHGNSTSSLDTLLALLETEAAKTEESSEALSEQLLSNELDVRQFIDSYLTTRAHMYQQKVKADKLFEIMYQQM